MRCFLSFFFYAYRFSILRRESSIHTCRQEIWLSTEQPRLHIYIHVHVHDPIIIYTEYTSMYTGSGCWHTTCKYEELLGWWSGGDGGGLKTLGCMHVSVLGYLTSRWWRERVHCLYFNNHITYIVIVDIKEISIRYNTI